MSAVCRRLDQCGQLVDTAHLQSCKSATNDEMLACVDMDVCCMVTDLFIDCIQQRGNPCGSKLGDNV